MENIPFHIAEIAKLYPIVASIENNLADGKIQIWDTIFIQNNLELPKVGSYLPTRTKYTLPTKFVDYGEVWVHLGNGYFKQVIKRKIGS